MCADDADLCAQMIPLPFIRYVAADHKRHDLPIPIYILYICRFFQLKAQIHRSFQIFHEPYPSSFGER